LPSSPWRENLAAAKANLLPGLILQSAALALVLAYYLHPAAHQAMENLAAYKSRLGLLYSLAATSLCGGLIPFLYLRLHPATRAYTPLSHGVFYLLLWAYKGLEIDLFYQAQGLMFGTEPAFSTILIKTAFDQFVYSPLWALPTVTLIFHWKETRFSFAAMRRLDVPGFLLAVMPKILIGCWAVWIPAVALVYSLPSSLQMPMFNLVLCFYSLLLVTLMRR
jgi:hypothetical protein